jgi:ribosomal protein L11 methyltransferase
MVEQFWTQVTLRVSPEALEPLADILQDWTGNGVTIEPPIEALGPDEGYTLDVTAPVTLRAYVYGPVPNTRRSALRRQLRRVGLSVALVGPARWSTIREEDWAEAWKAHYDIERVGRIVIRPAWREYEAKGDEVVVSLDPGMAFGTGQHPTTRMCLEALQDLIEAGDRVLDLGAGSGILAIAAVRIGASHALAIDTEEQAVAASISNAELNGLSSQIEERLGSIEAVGEEGPFDLVLANINAVTLIRLAGEISTCVKPGAPLVLSGIIAEREADCISAYEATGMHIERRLREADWRALIARGSTH